MSAEILRRAAALMRERAEAATAGPWRAGERCVWTEGLNDDVDDSIVSDGPHGNGGVIDPPDATHIASWHPAVSLAVADWLEATAAENDSPDDGALGFLNFIGADAIAAVAVARAYLGETA